MKVLIVLVVVVTGLVAAGSVFFAVNGDPRALVGWMVTNGGLALVVGSQG